MRSVADAVAVLAMAAAIVLPSIECRLEIIPPSGGSIYTIEEIQRLTRSMPPEDGAMGKLVVSHPIDACTRIDRPPGPRNESFSWFLLVRDAGCAPYTKLVNAREAGYSGMILYGSRDNFDIVDIPVFIVNDHGIYAILVTSQDGRFLKNCSFDKGFIINWYPTRSINLLNFLIPGIVILLVCILSLASMLAIQHCVRWYRERQRNARHRLARKYLRQLPIKKYKKGDEFQNYEVCSICLDEYQEGDKLRILPCQHGYHSKCIDPWLTKNKRVCPLCKRHVVLPGMEDNLSDDETTPLLGPRSVSSGGTFSDREQTNRTVQIEVHVDSTTEPQMSSSAPATAPAGLYSLNDEIETLPRRVPKMKRRRSRRPREPLDDMSVAGPSTSGQNVHNSRPPATAHLVRENQMLCVTEMGSDDDQPLVV